MVGTSKLPIQRRKQKIINPVNIGGMYNFCNAG